MIENVIAEKQQEIMDLNAEIGDKAASNRIAFLNPFSFHPNLIVKALESYAEQPEALDLSRFLQDKILS